MHTHDTRPKSPDRIVPTAIVVKALDSRDRLRAEPLAEVKDLAQTAGIRVLDSFSQRIDRPHPATYLGKGKIEDATRRSKELDVDFLIADNDLSPAQERNLERLSGRTVVDRSQLIMDIFAQRAQTHQAKLQVELAQLRYTAPRLKRLWTHLSRYEGGIGMRGPGETQLETDKRLMRRRIQRLVRELDGIERRKERALEKRQDEFVVALVGYTNAGKSTLLNRLTDSREFVEDKLFATLDTRVRRWPLDGVRYVLVTDTVGFIRALPHHLVASFHATLAETQRADLLLHVVDASSDEAPWQVHTVRDVLRRIDCEDKPTWLVLNKWDAVAEDKIIDAHHLLTEARRCAPFGKERAALRERPTRQIHLSARTGEGIDRLRDAVLEHLEERDSKLRLVVPHDRGDVMSFIRGNAKVTETRYDEEGVDVRFHISPAREARLRQLFPAGFPGPVAKAPWE